MPAFFLSILFCIFSATAVGGETADTHKSTIASHLDSSHSALLVLEHSGLAQRILLSTNIDEERDPGNSRSNSVMVSTDSPTSFFPLYERSLFYFGISLRDRSPILGQSSGLAPPVFS